MVNYNFEHFVGRKEYLDDLESLWRKTTSSLIACRGRRRIGKSTMIREFARRTAEVYIEIEGLPPDREMTNRRQLDHFIKSLADQTASSKEPVDNWLEAFHRLDDQIDESIVGEVQKKLSRIPRRKNMSLRPVLVYAGELSMQVEGSGFFDAVIPAEKLLV